MAKPNYAHTHTHIKCQHKLQAPAALAHLARHVKLGLWDQIGSCFRVALDDRLHERRHSILQNQ